MIILHVRQAFEGVLGCKYAMVLKWHGCVFKDYAEFCICLIMAPYPSKMPKYASTCLNVPKYT